MGVRRGMTMLETFFANTQVFEGLACTSWSSEQQFFATVSGYRTIRAPGAKPSPIVQS